MKHSVEVAVSRESAGGVVCCKRVSIRERMMRLLFGEKQRMTILLPGDTVAALHICEVQEGGMAHEPN